MTSLYKPGNKVHTLTVLDDFVCIHTKHGTKYKLLCRCDCGSEHYYFAEALQKRRVDYCVDCRPLGIRNTKLYHVYHGMLQRCYNKKSPSFGNYGRAGISVCDEWRNSYDEFFKWAMANGYREGLTIDRIDSAGNYEPGNCRWITLSENSARANVNRQKNHTKLHNITAESSDGEIIVITNIAKFCREHNLNVSNVNAAIRGRIRNLYRGWYFTCDEQGTRNDYRKTAPEEKSAV